MQILWRAHSNMDVMMQVVELLLTYTNIMVCRDFTPAKGVIAVIVMASMFAAVLLIFVCRFLYQNGDPDQVRLSPPHVRPDDDEPVTGYPVETRTGVGLHQDVQIGIPMMPSSPIRPDVSTLPSIGLERRIPANSGGNMFSSFSPSRSVAGDGSDSGRPLTDRN
ncbi:hypothetical protein SeMB42_g04605 [Synchytrium endobioticum]|uniref:Uncharacterized protein n=1 Tax=Synchytrium endobioticum TaxID=286115 RepID=A0A507CX60_9FUNG|nr:hypothetical protein SeMB42_g04605 [Synchytrium endobioticum]